MPCKSCKHSALAENKVLECRLYPPNAFPMMHQDRITGQPMMTIQSIFTPVSPELECGQYEEVTDKNLAPVEKPILRPVK